MDGEEALFKRAMIEASVATVVVATVDKPGAHAPHLVAGLAAIDHLVVEHAAAQALCAPLLAQALQLQRTDAPIPPQRAK